VSEDIEWVDPLDENGLWERQTSALTVGSLIRALSEITDQDVPVEVAWYDGATIRQLVPMHLDVRANRGRVAAVVLTLS
jgi:hypothetical protein